MTIEIDILSNRLDDLSKRVTALEIAPRAEAIDYDHLTVREAARRRIPLDGADAQALEGALSQVERELRREEKAHQVTREEPAKAGGDVLALRRSEEISNARIRELGEEGVALRRECDEAREELAICQKMNSEQAKLITKLSGQLDEAREALEPRP